jgi:hypothetical protein
MNNQRYRLLVMYIFFTAMCKVDDVTSYFSYLSCELHSAVADTKKSLSCQKQYWSVLDCKIFATHEVMWLF